MVKRLHVKVSKDPLRVVSMLLFRWYELGQDLAFVISREGKLCSWRLRLSQSTVMASELCRIMMAQDRVRVFRTILSKALEISSFKAM